MAANCVSTSCRGAVASAREGSHGRQQQAAAQSLSRTAFCGEKVAASLKAQAWAPAPKQLRRSASMPARLLQVASVLAERVDQTIVSIAQSLSMSTCFVARRN
jgi:glucose-1-phosphate adenylyltransferase